MGSKNADSARCRPPFRRQHEAALHPPVNRISESFVSSFEPLRMVELLIREADPLRAADQPRVLRVQCSRSLDLEVGCSRFADTISAGTPEHSTQWLATTQRPAGCGIIHMEIVCQTPSLDLR